MIDIKVRIHDKFSVEFKVGYIAREKDENTEFTVNTWFFVPHSLDINTQTYTKWDFYKDLKSNIRLITPIFSLKRIAEGPDSPFGHLEGAFDALVAEVSDERVGEYEYQIKMFGSIFKSALREEVQHIIRNPVAEDRGFLVGDYLAHVRQITEHYRLLRRKINVVTMPKDAISYFLFGDEYISNLVENHTFYLMDGLKQQVPETYAEVSEALLLLIREEIRYKKERGYLSAEKESHENNRSLIYRRGLLKKYAESELFLKASKRKDAIWVEQIYYSLAAGLSMIFATIVAFSFQQKYGNYTMPVFVALVVAYMLKDRIKELARYYFASRMGRRYFDHKTTISIKQNQIGWIKEAFDFVAEEKVPEEVMSMRARSDLLEAENRTAGEKIILYRKLVYLDPEALKHHYQYETVGINDIMRLNLSGFVQRMDSRDYELFVPEGEKDYGMIIGEKIYYLNFLMQFRYKGKINYRRFRLLLNHDGIQSIQEL